MPLNKKPSSRKRHRWSIEPGDLVQVIPHMRYAAAAPKKNDAETGVVVSVYSANVYEGSSAEVLVSSRKMLVDTKYLIRIDYNAAESE